MRQVVIAGACEHIYVMADVDEGMVKEDSKWKVINANLTSESIADH